MTLEPYDAKKLDETALRLLDLAAISRRMAIAARENPGLTVALNDKKALEWLGRLEQWAHDCATKMDLSLIKHRGAQRAQQILG